MWWYVLQCAVMLAVCWTGIYYQWTPNNYLLGLLGVIAAWLVTRAIVLAPTALRFLKAATRWLLQEFVTL